MRRPLSYFALAIAAAASIATSAPPSWDLYGFSDGPSLTAAVAHPPTMLQVHVTATPASFPSDGSGKFAVEVGLAATSGAAGLTVTLVPTTGVAQSHDLALAFDPVSERSKTVLFSDQNLPCDIVKRTCAADFLVEVAALSGGPIDLTSNVQVSIKSPREEFPPPEAKIDVTVELAK
jgi:hypothetical protein